MKHQGQIKSRATERGPHAVVQRTFRPKRGRALTLSKRQPKLKAAGAIKIRQRACHLSPKTSRKRYRPPSTQSRSDQTNCKRCRVKMRCPMLESRLSHFRCSIRPLWPIITSSSWTARLLFFKRIQRTSPSQNSCSI